jgi:hypothetical protein
MFEGRVGFAVGTGRCGTRFLQQVMSREPGIASTHERNPLAENFHRYCQWYRLPVDEEAFVTTKRKEIEADLQSKDFSFEASAPLSLSIDALYQAFGARFVLMVRSPERVINSYISKGWYAAEYWRRDPNLAPGFQAELPSRHHSFSRIVPSGSEYEDWCRMGRVGKLAWYWNALNRAVLDQFERIPEVDRVVIRLEDLSYDRYRELLSFFGRPAQVSRQVFETIARRRPNRRDNVPTTASWGDADWSDFFRFVDPLAQHFGYDVQSLPEKAKAGRPDLGNRPGSGPLSDLRSLLGRFAGRSRK